MPLIDMSADEAVATRKSNRFGSWGDRSGVNRVEPVATPEFETPFRLEPGEPIFTIGSCFARNVETALAARGYRIPVREVLRRPEFAHLEAGIINNYGAPSIFNELAWAFDERPMFPHQLIAEITPGKFADLHFSPALRPDSWEVTLARREAVRSVYREAAKCRVVIITLGLSEVWFDTSTGYYLNVSPRPSMIRAEPDRFRLHVLSFQETLRYLEGALAILRRHGRPDLRVLLTVSPVPLTATNRPIDVMVANSYSKSVLRTAAETVVTTHDWVTYYPSYESVVLSDRRRAYIDDMVHVSDEIVAFNVARMVDAFTTSNDDLDSMTAAIEGGGEPMAVQKAREVPAEIADAFFAAHGNWSTLSIPFAMAHARHLITVKRPAEAEEILAPFVGSDDPDYLALIAEAALKNGRPETALAHLDALPDRGLKAFGVWNQLLSAAIAIGDPAQVISVVSRYTTNLPNRAPSAYLSTARYFRARGDRAKALDFYRAGYAQGASAMVDLEVAELLLVTGKVDDANALIAVIAPQNGAQETALGRLKLLAAGAS